MGFGILLIGYMFFLNIAYFTITDIISALVLTMAFYKLSSVNKYFKAGIWISIPFAVLALGELAAELYGMFFPSFDAGALISVIEMPRYAIMAVITALILLGIADVANEVGLTELCGRCRLLFPIGTVIYAISTLLCIPGLESIADVRILAVATVVCIGAQIILVVFNMYLIYKAYARICMPGEDNTDDGPSRFGFVNKFREHEAEKQREYAEYQIEKQKKRNAKKGKRNDKGNNE